MRAARSRRLAGNGVITSKNWRLRLFIRRIQKKSVGCRGYGALSLVEKLILPKALSGQRGVKTPCSDRCDAEQNANSPDGIPV